MTESQRRFWIDDLIVAVAATITFARSLGFGLIESWDDARFLVDFEPIRKPGLDALAIIWSGPHFEAFHPLHLMSYWLDVPWSNGHGPTIHAVSLLMWIGALFLLRRVFTNWGLSPVAAIVATLFAGLHPNQVEAVTWATGRKEVLALALSCAALLSDARSSQWTDRNAWLSRVFFACAMLSKTAAAPLPLVMLLQRLLMPGPRTGQPAPRFREKLQAAALALWVHFAIAIALSTAVFVIWSDHEMIRKTPDGLFRAHLVACTYTHYLGGALLPIDTSPMYALHRTADSVGLSCWLGPIAIALMAIVWRTHRRGLFALLSFVVLLLPVSNIVPLYFEVQDRYLSLPLTAIGFGLGVALDTVKLPRKVLIGVGGSLVIAYAALCIRYQAHWSSDAALWGHATQTHSEAFYAWMKLGELRRDSGDFEEAIAAYDHAVELQPTLRLAHGARFSAFAIRDQETYELPDKALELAGRYMQNADAPEKLRELAGDMVVAGYREAALVPLGRSLDLDPLPAQRLQAAARVQQNLGNEWLVEFYRARFMALAQQGSSP